MLSALVGVQNVTELDLPTLINNLTVPLSEYVSIFLHPEHGGPAIDANLVGNDSAWTITTPHPFFGGRCYTYNPGFQSLPGMWYGIRLAIEVIITKK